MKKSTMIWIGILLIVVVIIVAFKFTGNAVSNEPGVYDEFAQCITDSGAIMYGAYWCPHCNNQKEAFGNSARLINYVECDARGDDADPAACQAAGIQGYPTWIFADGQRVAGEIALQELAFRTNCTLPAAQ